jgi:chloramphenicol 3-O phosphotransferase
MFTVTRRFLARPRHFCGPDLARFKHSMEEKEPQYKMQQGQIILLNGTSSAGKTTIAKQLQEILEPPYLHTGIDHFLAAVPWQRLFVYSDSSSQTDADGWFLPFRDGVLIDTPRLGPLAYQLMDGMYASFATLAAAGINLIVDDVIYDPHVFKSAVNRLAGCDVLFVGLHCPIEEAVRREKVRGDRAPGGAAIFHGLVHRHSGYDLELDTAQLSPTECAEQIQLALQQRSCTALSL